MCRPMARGYYGLTKTLDQLGQSPWRPGLAGLTFWGEQAETSAARQREDASVANLQRFAQISLLDCDADGLWRRITPIMAVA